MSIGLSVAGPTVGETLCALWIAFFQLIGQLRQVVEKRGVLGQLRHFKLHESCLARTEHFTRASYL